MNIQCKVYHGYLKTGQAEFCRLSLSSVDVERTENSLKLLVQPRQDLNTANSSIWELVQTAKAVSTSLNKIKFLFI